MAETYGLEPNYGCCTANFNQGWPKFAHSIFYVDARDGGVVIATWAPAEATYPDGTRVRVRVCVPRARRALCRVHPRPPSTWRRRCG